MRVVPAGLIVVLAGCGRQGVEINGGALKLFKPLPAQVSSSSNPVTESKVVLGRMLYHDPRLSRNRDVSCDTCHPLDRYGADGKALSDGHLNQKGSRNSPSVYNAAGHIAQFWDGRAADVEEQAKGPVLNPVEMAIPSEAHVAAVLGSVSEYAGMFRRAFPEERDPVTLTNAARAIGAFERRLLTPSRWDRFLNGDESALNNAEKEGFNTFVASGCAACHYGPYVGGNAFQRLGLSRPWESTADLGRFNVTRIESDKFVFKVPSLRNVARTGPYFHDGSIPNLSEAVRKMSHYQVGRNLEAKAVTQIVVWLNALTGELPPEYVSPPVLPAAK